MKDRSSGIRCVLVVGACFLTIGCGTSDDGTGGSGGAGGSGPMLSVDATTPTDGATDVALGATTTVTFDVAVDEATVSGSVSLMTDDGRQVPGSASVDPMSGDVVFTPDAPLALLSGYTATVSTDIRGSAGERLAAPATWRFTTRDGAWGTAQRLENEPENEASRPVVAINPSGRAVAAYTLSDPTFDAPVTVNTYTPQSGWTTAERLGGPPITDRGGVPSAAIDREGNAWVVAQMFPDGGGSPSTYAVRYTPTGGWGNPEEIDERAAEGPRVVIDDAGNALSVSLVRSGGGGSVGGPSANRWTPTGGWGVPEPVNPSSLANTGRLELDIDAAGNAVAVWPKRDGARSDIWANRFTPTTGWGTPERIEADNTGSAGPAQVAVAPDGSAVAVWIQLDGTGVLSVWSNRYSPDSGWRIAEPIEEAFDDSSSPRVAIDAAGNAIAVWLTEDGLSEDLRWNRLPAGGEWGTPETLVEENASLPAVGMDAAGNAIALWGELDSAIVNLWSSRYTLAGGWAAPALIEISNAGSVREVRVAVGENGQAAAVWTQNDGDAVPQAWANVFE